MELYFLKSDFSLLEGPIDTFTSAVWSEKYYEVGSFAIHLPRSFAGLCQSASYIRTEYDRSGRCRCGRITYVTTDVTAGSPNDCEVGGCMLEGLLGDRVMYGKGSAVGGVSAVLSAVGDNLRALPVEVDLGGSADFADSVSLTWDWDRMSDWLYGVLRPYGASFSVTLGKDDTIPVLRIIKGRDLSGGDESGEQRAVFSSSYGNIFSIEFEKDDGKLCNLAYVEGYDGAIVEVDKSSGSTAGVREIYKKAADVNPSKYDDEEKYRAALRQRGEEALAKYPSVLSVSAQSSPAASPVFGLDYALGDICGVSDAELGLCTSLRLTAVDTVSESGEVTVYPYFGETIKFRDAMEI
ncbi:MAG: hypothetical protein ACI4XJ_00930 [Eubacteriales bacterium]